MKILLVSLSNRGGGAARAVDSLAKALMKTRHEVEVLTYEGERKDYPITVLCENRWTQLVFRLKNKVANWLMRLFANPSHDYRSINIFPSHKLLQAINQSDADIVNFHWYGAEMLSIAQIAKIKKPIVWMLHDAWMVNGVYHVSPIDYFPYQNEDGNNWLDKWVYARKKKAYSKVSMHFITPSRWITDRFLNGELYKPGDTSVVIRNLIDTGIWRPTDKKVAKDKLGFSKDKTHVFYIANNILTSFNKGFVFVKKLIERCGGDYEFHFVGNKEQLSLEHTTMHGRTTDQVELALYYSAADICIVPSLSESMSYVTIESLLCNTPVLCFDTTGPAEIIINGVNGYKAKKFDADDLYHGLEELRHFNSNIPLRETIPDFDPELNLGRYLKEYERVIGLSKES